MTINQENINLINRIKHYIQENVREKLPLEKLAKEANYSVFHFQKIFKAVENETPKQYIKRVRLENAAHLLILSPKMSILEVAFENGFTSLEAFSRGFKNYYGVSPIYFKKNNREENNLILQSKTNKDDKGAIQPSSYFLTDNFSKQEVTITTLSRKKFIYIPVTLTDIETIQNAYNKIKKWALARQLFRPHSQLFALMKDYPEYTTLSKCRFETCVEVDSKPEISTGIFYQELPTCTYAKFKVDGGINELIKAVTQFSINWLPESGFEIKHSPAIIVPLEDPITKHPHEISYDVYIAVKSK